MPGNTFFLIFNLSLFSVDVDVNSSFLKSGTRTICRNGLEAPFCGVRVSTRFHHVWALVNAKTGEQLNHSRGVAQHVPAKCGWIDTRWGLPVISWFINWLIKVYPPENPSFNQAIKATRRNPSPSGSSESSSSGGALGEPIGLPEPTMVS